MKIFLSMLAAAIVAVGIILAVAIVTAGIILLVAREAPAQPMEATQADPTNPEAIRLWYQSLRNKLGGSCCGEGDAYPVDIIREPTPNEYAYDGVAVVTNPTPPDVVIKGWNGNNYVLHRPAIKGELTFTYMGLLVSKEELGTPLSHAIAFLRVDEKGNIAQVYCVVPLPPGS